MNRSERTLLALVVVVLLLIGIIWGVSQRHQHESCSHWLVAKQYHDQFNGADPGPNPC